MQGPRDPRGPQFEGLSKFNDVLRIGMPKGGRTFGRSDESFLSYTHITPFKESRVDGYYARVKGYDGSVALCFEEMKTKALLSRLAVDDVDAIIVGKEAKTEFDLACGIDTGVEILNFNLAPCFPTIAVLEDDPARTLANLNGYTIATECPNILRDATFGKVNFSKVISEIMLGVEIPGGLERVRAFKSMAKVNAICGNVESGESLVKNGWRPLDVSPEGWSRVQSYFDGHAKKPNACKYTALPEVEGLQATLMRSCPVLVRTAKPMSEEKEKLLSAVAYTFGEAAKNQGAKPVVTDFRPSQQTMRLVA